MEQKIAIITGADGGMGTAITKTVVNAGFHVVMACRNMEKAAKVKDKLEKETGATIDLQALDLASVASVLRFANEMKSRYTSSKLPKRHCTICQRLSSSRRPF